MKRPPEPDPQYEQARRALLERGYLDGRIESFLLRDLLAGGSPLWKIVRSAIRAGLVGGMLLGALLAVATATANRPLLGAADWPLLWIYFSLPSALVLIVLDLVAALAVGALAQRRGPRKGDFYRAAFLVGGPLLAYLMLIWWMRGPTDLLQDGLFLFGAAAAVLLVAWLAGLVSLAGILGRTGEVPDRHRRPVLVMALVPILVVAALFVARAMSDDGAEYEPPPEFSVRKESARLLYIGVDGLDTGIVQSFEPRGAVSGLLDGLRGGAVFPMQRRPGPEPPEVWTTLLTGMPAERHGITSAGAERLPGVATPLNRSAAPLPLEAALRFLLPSRTVPTTGATRRVRTIWEILALRRPTAAVGWWTTWPAGPFHEEDHGGYVVSDRVLPKLLSGATMDRDTWPAALFDRLSSDFAVERDSLREAFLSDFPISPGSAIQKPLWESFLIDAFNWQTAQKLRLDDSVTAVFVYLPGLEILRFRIAPRGDETELGTLLEIQEALELYVAWLDRLVGPALQRPGDGWRTLLVADPGRHATAETEGFVAVVGQGIEPACVGPVVSDLDLAPLALELQGFPRSAEMPSQAPRACVQAIPAPQTQVASYGRRGAQRSPPVSDYDPEMVERLKSLGYLN